MDAGSHSASDTLTRTAPTYALMTALLVELFYERGEPLAR